MDEVNVLSEVLYSQLIMGSRVSFNRNSIHTIPERVLRIRGEDISESISDEIRPDCDRRVILLVLERFGFPLSLEKVLVDHYNDLVCEGDEYE